MSARQRTKGAAAEREIVQILHREGWGLAERTSRGTAQLGRGDIAYGPAGVHLEVKRQEALSVPKAFDQAKRDAHGLDIPVIVHRPSRHEWMATLPFEELLALLRLREFG
jgi:hypothetical protein